MPADYGRLDRRIGSQNDAWFFSVAHYQKLIARLGVEGLPDCPGLIEAVRRRKSPWESRTSARRALLRGLSGGDDRGSASGERAGDRK